MFQIDPWEKAADCARSIEQEPDPTRQAAIASIRDLWINLANERAFLTDAELNDQAAMISRVQLELSSSGQTVA
jgi:hypothetical protein